MLQGPNLQPTSTFQLDWRSYFYEFCQVHGGAPVPYPYSPQGAPAPRLLFQDGWMYSATDYSGPEIAPPEEGSPALTELLITYWKTRYIILNEESNKLRKTIINLKHLQSVKSAPLQQITTHYDPEVGKYVANRTTLDYEGMEGQLRMIEEDLAEAEKHLIQLHGGIVHVEPQSANPAEPVLPLP